ncbi:helix-turn-helix domain-containing protein [Pseudooceanicola sp.]|uniref:winged helix-turn-helix transcriptional regulator n=1 Tax=Pseudooceanicola sp. TaxID=1914328 RepID=UPI00261DA223|nr:helix-turn-helix domain-containing protein [Pseudooceanicola sp.]MDF1854308.1 helix-turn-helix domain-containing protein [Pseudooceanicola sp.]
MAGKRFYNDGCGVAQALDLVGERWALLVARELLFAPRRFSDLKSDLPGIATNILSQRLNDLAEAGILAHCDMDDGKPTKGYQLTDWGRELAPVFKVTGRWMARSPRGLAEQAMSATAVILSLASHFRPQRAKGLTLRVACVLSGREFTLVVANRQLEVSGGRPISADLILSGDQNALLWMLLDDEPDPAVTIDGDPIIFDQFAACFQRFQTG